jgi:integrase
MPSATRVPYQRARLSGSLPPWLACDKLSYPCGSTLLLTGQRRNEVSGMAWAEIDLDKALWTIPGGRTKNDEAHEVPLTDAALSVIASMPGIL